MKSDSRFSWIAASAVVGLMACSVAVFTLAQEPPGDGQSQEQKPAAAGDEAEPYAIPDGTPEELLTFVDKLLNTAPGDKSAEGLAAHRDKTIEAVTAATTRVMESPEASPKQAARAAEVRLQVLTLLARTGDEDAGKQLEAFRNQIRSDERPAVRMVIMPQELLQRLAGWSQLDEAGRDTWMADLVVYLEAVELDAQDGALVSYAMNMLEQMDDREAATELVNRTAPVFEASDNEKIAAVADRLRSSLRFLNLEGSQMEVEGKLLGGGEFDWSKYEDKVVLVDFWATWCGPCIRELPNVVENYKKYYDKGFEVVGISLDTDAEKVKEFVERREIPWPILFSDNPDATGWEHPMAVKYGIQAIPAAVLVDRSGTVVTKDARGSELGDQLQKLLGDPDAVEDEAAEAESPGASSGG